MSAGEIVLLVYVVGAVIQLVVGIVLNIASTTFSMGWEKAEAVGSRLIFGVPIWPIVWVVTTSVNLFDLFRLLWRRAQWGKRI